MNRQNIDIASELLSQLLKIDNSSKLLYGLINIFNEGYFNITGISTYNNCDIAKIYFKSRYPPYEKVRHLVYHCGIYKTIHSSIPIGDCISAQTIITNRHIIELQKLLLEMI